MPIKGIFNRNNKKEQPLSSTNEFEKQILRINALEVQIKKLMEFEKQLRTSMYGSDKEEKERGSRNEPKNTLTKKSQMETHSRDDRVKGKEFQNNELFRRIEKLEKIVQKISSRQEDTYAKPHDRGSVDEKQLQRVIERIVAEKLAAQYNRQEEWSEIQEESDSFSSRMNMRILVMERNYLLINEVQAGLMKRMDELVEKHNELLRKWEESERDAAEQNPNMRTLYIDKLYLDKYEQNNNFAQIGIHELSGALNIGATYGKDVIPKNITEEAKEEMEKMKAAKEEMEKQQTGTEELGKTSTDESSADSTSIPPEDEEPYTEIDIEDDPAFDKDSF